MASRSILVVCLAAWSLGTLACARDVERAKQEYMERADRYMAEKNVDAAIIEYRNAIQQDPQFGEAYRKLSAAYMNRGEGSEALRTAITAADLLPQSPEAQVEAGELLLLAGRFAEARVRAQQALTQNANFTRGRVLLGNSIAGLKDIDAAIKEFEEAIRLDPHQSGVYTGLAALKATQGDLEAAEGTFKQAIDTDPKSVRARLALAQFYWLTERLPEAEQALKGAIEVAPNDSTANVALAVFYQATRRAAEAEPYLRAAVAADPNPRVKIAAADYYITHNRAAEAKPLLAPLAADRRVGALVSLRLAGIAQVEGRNDEALKILDEALVVEPKNALVLTAKSDVLRVQQKLDEAVKAADAAIAVNPTSAAAHFVRGRVLAAQGREETAAAAFGDTLRLNPRAAAARVELARLKLRGDAGEAVSLATQATKDDPRSLEARLTLSRALIEKQDYVEARKQLDELARLVPDSAAVHAQLGTLMLRKRDMAGARAAFARAVELEPRQLDALEGLTTLDFSSGQRAEALARLEGLLARYPSDFGLLMVAGKAYGTAKDLPAAERMLVRAVEANPSAMSAYSLLGQVYIAQNRLPAARAQFEKVAASTDRPVGALTVLGMIDLMEDRIPDAQRSFERVIKVDPRAAVASNNLAWIYAEHGGSLDQALQLALVAKAELPKEAEVHDTLGWIYYQKGDLSSAIEALEQSLELAPKNATAAYHLALAYEKSGSRAEARRMFTQYLTLDGTSDRSADVKRRLQALGT